MTEHDSRPTTIDRRTLMRGVAVGGAALPLLAACGGGSDSAGSSGSPSDSASDSASASAGDSASASGGASSSGGAAAGGTTVAAADVPVGGGTILTNAKVVVTQPKKGTFAAFSAVCTHQGCLVDAIEQGEIVCPCHGSHFSISDGSPVSGPASSPLPGKKVSVAGGKISVT
jgi:nitrite reductase/ring-hydroxylating ferredoxin subunit